MRDPEQIFDSLQRSAFRWRFELGAREKHYVQERGMDVVLDHARGIIQQRLAPAQPANDGRQTPMRRHPVFIAQHATATCCRSCLEKWHDIASGHPLSVAEVAHIVSVIERWLRTQTDGRPASQRELFRRAAPISNVETSR